ncbi:IS200/IS605 family transposase [Paracoccus litorisediminis]|uniref:IS200/IS605 family transposase n=1 Tax=Paracoccus litorisediminis TaxID=2006130 RepID=UPI003731CFC5
MSGQELSQLNHCVYSLRYHLVLVTKYRRAVLSDAMLHHLERTARERAADWNGAIHEFNGEVDHLHLLLELPPTVALAEFVNALKTASSRLLRRDFPELKARFREPVLWSRSYFVASCGGAPLEAIRAYIQAQDRPPGRSGQ